MCSLKSVVSNFQPKTVNVRASVLACQTELLRDFLSTLPDFQEDKELLEESGYDWFLVSPDLYEMVQNNLEEFGAGLGIDVFFIANGGEWIGVPNDLASMEEVYSYIEERIAA